MTTPEIIFAACTALGLLGGFVFEWRRQGAQDQRLADVESRVDAMESRLVVVEGWRDRIGRSW